MTQHELRVVAAAANTASATAHYETCLAHSLGAILSTDQCRHLLEATTDGR